MQVCVEEDEVNVALQVLQAPQQQLLTLLLRLTTFDLRKEVNKALLVYHEGTKQCFSYSNNCSHQPFAKSYSCNVSMWTSIKNTVTDNQERQVHMR